MGWSYKRLWKKLVDESMKKTDLLKTAGISSAALAKMGKNEPVTMTTLGKICETLDCNLEDIVEYISEADRN